MRAWGEGDVYLEGVECVCMGEGVYTEGVECACMGRGVCVYVEGSSVCAWGGVCVCIWKGQVCVH